MAFTDYKDLTILKAKHPQIIINTGEFIPKLSEIIVEEYLEKDIQQSIKTYRGDSFYIREALISPVLRYVWHNMYLKDMNMWTHQDIKYDDDLCGIPDFMFTHLDQEQYQIPSYPILTIMEAKLDNFVEGWAQCIAQMFACQKLNANPNVVIYGIVTTGKFWEFAKLEGNLHTRNISTYTINDLPKLITVLDYLLGEAKKQL